MGDLAEFQIDQDVAAQQAVIENQIHEEVVFVEGEAPLPRLEEEALAHFQQEALDLADDGGFQVGLGILAALVQADRKSTRLNSSHLGISYAVFCLKKK